MERTADGMTPEEQLRAISSVVRELIGEHSRCLMNDVLPGPGRARRDAAPEPRTRSAREDRAHLDAYFQANVFPVLTPLAVDPGHPFPYISNLSLSLAVVLRGPDGEERFARVKVPKILPRWVPLTAPNSFVPLEQVIGSNLESLFPGVEILGWYLFRITRNTDLQIEIGDEAEDLLSLIQEEVRNRRFAEVVRIEVHSDDAGLAPPAAARRVHASSRSRPPCSSRRRISTRSPGLMDTADLLSLSALDVPGAARPRLPSGHQPAAGLRAEHLRRDPRRRHPAPPPVRQLRDLASSGSSRPPPKIPTCSRSS